MKKMILIAIIFVALGVLVSTAYAGDLSKYGMDMEGKPEVVVEPVEYIQSKTLAIEVDQIVVSGQLPVVIGLENKSLEAELNRGIQAAYEAKLLRAKEGRVRKLEFSYEVKTDGEYSTLLVYSILSSGSIANDVDTFCFVKTEAKIVLVADVLERNAVSVVNRIVMEEIKKAPEKYNSNFRGISEQQDFYLENGELVILFDKYEIAPGSEGIVKIPVTVNRVIHSQILKDMYYTKSNYDLKMIPLRSVCEDLGFEVVWDENTSVVTVKKGSFSSALMIGKNVYVKSNHTSRTLESAPELKDGVSHVPVSFMDLILEASFSTDENGDILFSRYDSLEA